MTEPSRSGRGLPFTSVYTIHVNPDSGLNVFSVAMVSWNDGKWLCLDCNRLASTLYALYAYRRKSSK
ncbi:hypothetical protein DY000_02044560 [Brassica cretica]|uniref:Uncharacterized protein n=1 Tax=Brassica cretica TaxID=69181 RepID=A0ABQ7EVP8_BRACR|nr:hypothetical protein DY000_02044560 [Brassica cretica]